MKKNTVLLAVKSARKQSREEEIKEHGKQITNKTTVVRSKKLYTRKNNAKSNKGLKGFDEEL